MNFDFTDEQAMLRDTLRAFLADNYGFDARRDNLRSASGSGSALWHRMAHEIGVLGASLPEAAGGFGGGALENMIVAEELGQVLATEPWIRAVIMSGILLDGAGAIADEMLKSTICGETVIIPTIDRGLRQYGAEAPTIVRQGKHYALNGELPLVRSGQRATHFLIVADERTHGRRSIILVPRDAEGLAVRSLPTVDGYGVAHLRFANVQVPEANVVAAGQAAEDRIAHALDAGVAALCAEALGIQRRLVDATVDYSKQRRQFGRPIGDFQVLQHRMADMFIKLEESLSMTYFATLRLDAEPRVRASAVSAAKVSIDLASQFIGQAAVQIHGGMGMTKELPVADAFARLTAIGLELGSTEVHLQRYESISFGPDVADC